MKIVQVLVVLALFTASFDKFMVIDIGGTVRIAQVMMLLVTIVSLGHVIQYRTINWPKGGSSLALWCMIQGVLITQSNSPVISLGLYLLLLSMVAFLFAVVQLYGRSKWLELLMKWYLLSFIFVCAFGVIQLISPPLHLGAPLVAQWIKPKVFARLNGFSYEPSYFATYLVLGWITLIDLRVNKSKIIEGRGWLWLVILCSVVLFMSTSKTAWIIMIFEFMARLFPMARRIFRQQIIRTKNGLLLIPLPRIRILFSIVAVVILASISLIMVSRIVDPIVFLGGTGISHSGAHSVNDRVDGLKDTWRVIEEHFWVGRSLGGVPASIAALHGQDVTNVSELRQFWGFPVILDVFAASGLIGFIPFAYFLWAITFGQRTLMKGAQLDERAKWLHALIRAFAVEWVALLADQNILRIYFWFHITVMMTVAYNLRYRADPSMIRTPERLAIA